MKRLFGILFVSLLSIQTGYAQSGRIQGFVSEEGGAPLQGVNVIVTLESDLVAGTTTDGDGFFVLNRLPSGTLTVTFSFVGFRSHIEQVEVDRAKTTTVRVTLVSAPTEFDELVIEAEREGGATVNAGVQTVVPADIDRLPMPGVSGDLIAVLQSTPSVVTSGDRGGQLFIRGGEPSQNSVRLDGIELFQPFHILGFYSAFPSELVNSANVYAGGFGAEFGGRISSVIDITARNGNKQRFSGSASVSPFLSTLHVEGPLIKDRVSIIASVRESLVKDVVPNLYGQKLPYSFGDQFVKVHSKVTPGIDLSATLIHTHDHGDIAGTKRTILGDVDNRANVDTSEVAWQNLGVGGKLVLQPGRLPFRTEITGSYSELTTDLGTPGIPERSASVGGYDLSAQIQYQLRRAQVVAGAFTRSTDLSYSLSGFFQEVADIDSVTVNEAGGFVELGVQPISRLNVTGGLRFHAYPNSSSATVEPRVRVSTPFEFSGVSQVVSVAAGVYHQGMVGLTDERDAGNIFTVWTAAQEGEKLPEATHLLAGWQGTLEVQNSFVVKASIEAYHKDLKNLSVPVWDAFPQFTTALQQANGTVNGVDFRAEVTLPSFYGYLGIGQTATEYTAAEGVQFGQYYGESQFAYTPPHDRRTQVNAVGRLDVGDVTLTAQWQFGSGLPYTQAVGFDDWIYLTGPGTNLLETPGQERVLYEAPYSSRLPDYHRLDLWLERKFKTDRLSGMIRAGVVNAYNRANLFYFDLFTLNRVEQLPAMPSVGFKLEF